MLLRFSVRNYRSIGEKQEISLVASNLDDERKALIEIENQRISVLPSAVIYGPNASGKSNLLRALRFFQKGVLESHAYKGKAENKVTLPQFLLNGVENIDSASFEMDFLMPYERKDRKLIRMTYGFVISAEGIIEEWLYSFPKQYKQILFHRSIDEDPKFYFGPSLKGHNKIISENTKPQSLFLSTAYANNHQQLTQVFEYFERMHFSLSKLDEVNNEQTSVFLEHDEMRKVILEYLGSADVGICDAKIEIEKRPKELDTLSIELKEVFSKYFKDEKIINAVTPDERKKISLGHKTDGGVVFMELNQESRGTVAFLNIIGWALIALQTGGLFIVDELDSSLHPLLCRKIVELFNNRQSNPRGSQLVFTTHDTTLLSSDLMRRDQIWFAEKDSRGSSNYYPLSDLKIRKTDNFEKGYLAGKFGAIPFLGDFNTLPGVQVG